MTTPNQVAADAFGRALDGKWGDLAAFVGQGAYQVADTVKNWGQEVDEEFARALMYGPAVLLADGWGSVASFIEAFGNYLRTLPLEMLQVLKAFIPDALEEAWLTVEGAVQAILDALHLDDVLMRLRTLFELFAIEQLKGVINTLILDFEAISWIPFGPDDVVAAIVALWRFVNGLGGWVTQVFENFTGITASSWTQFLQAIWDKFLLDELQSVWSTFVTEWSDNLPNILSVPGIKNAVAAVIHLFEGIVKWMADVINNIFGVQLNGLFSAAFAIDLLQSVWTTFETTVSGLNLLSPAGLLAALWAAVDLGFGLGGWVVQVIQNFTNLDISALGGALSLRTIQTAFETFFTNVGIGGVTGFISAVIALFQSLGNYVLTLLQNFLGMDTNTVHSAMFTSFPNFSTTMIDYWFGDFATFRDKFVEFFFGFTWTSVVDWWSGIFGSITGQITGLQTALALLQTAFDNIGATIYNTITGAEGALADLWSWISSQIYAAITGAAGELTALWTWVSGQVYLGITGLVGELGSIGGWITQQITGIADMALSYVPTWITQQITGSAGSLSYVGSWVASQISSSFATIASQITHGTYTSLSNVYNWVLGVITGQFSTIASQITGGYYSTLSSVGNWITGQITGSYSPLSYISSWVTPRVTQVLTGQTTYNLIQYIVRQVTGNAYSTLSGLSTYINAVVTPVKTFINSTIIDNLNAALFQVYYHLGVLGAVMPPRYVFPHI